MLGRSHVRIVGLLGAVALIGALAACGSVHDDDTERRSAGGIDGCERRATRIGSGERSGRASDRDHVLVLGAGHRRPGRRLQREPGRDPRQLSQRRCRQRRVHGPQDGARDEHRRPRRRAGRVPAPALVHRARRPRQPERPRRRRRHRPGSRNGRSPRARRAMRCMRTRRTPGPMIMMCNKALLDEHGVAVPTTWDEVVSASRGAARRRPERVPDELHARPGPLVRAALAVRRAPVRGRRREHHDRAHLARGDPGRPALGRPALVRAT